MTGHGPACAICNARFEPERSHCPHDGAPLTRPAELLAPDPYLGRVVFDKYRLERLIGWGAMGRVYRATSFAEPATAALKILHRRLCEDEKLVRRFNREARLAAQLDHPKIIKLYEHGVLEDAGGGALPAIAMEYLSGASLRSLLARTGHGLPPSQAIGICQQIASAVAHAHDRGIVHRDLKPANVMLCDAGAAAELSPPRTTVKVLDFGLAKSTLDPGSLPTVKGTVLGTPHYISPEAALGEPVTLPSDVYSLAVVLFECLSGRPPFDAANPISVLVQHTSQPPPRLSTMPGLAALPNTLVELVAQNLSKSPGERQADAGAFARALRAIADDCGADLTDPAKRPGNAD